MTEDHIETVVMDEPYTGSRTDESEDERHDQADIQQPLTDAGEETLLSWLS